MKIYYLLSSALLIIFSQTKNSKGDNSCGTWESFKDEKCFKLFDNVETHDAAIALCKASTKTSTATLASVLSQEEQTFLENYIFKKLGSLNSVWIGAKKLPESHFAWDDGNRFDYTNFDKEDKHNEGDDCLEMEYQKPETGKQGKWIDIKCTSNKKNQVLCQFSQTWTLDQLVKTFLGFRKDFKDSSDSINDDLNNHEKYINDLNGRTQNLVANPVPLNFIYIQLPTQPEPSVLWPGVKWEDVSVIYAGLFFRVLGGSSEKFGTIQNETSPRLASVEMIQTAKAAARPQKLDIPANGADSAQLYAGSSPAVAAQSFDDHLKFKLTAGEVRPRNQAVKVWKRVK